nr:MAG TPA: hypothetical protein [Caudoviricetes sp.]
MRSGRCPSNKLGPLSGRLPNERRNTYENRL